MRTSVAVPASAPGTLSVASPKSRRRRGRTLALIAGGSVVVAVLALAVLGRIGATQWARDTAALDQTLAGHGAVAAQTRVTFAGLEALPAPVQRYLRLALHEGQPLIKVARFRQQGRLRTAVESDAWLSFEATEAVAPEAANLLWDARVRLAPLLHAAMRDSYIDGTASGHVGLQSFITLAEERGGHDLNAGDLYRLLAEAPWFPTLLLPRPELTWKAIDDRRALATLAHGGETVAVEFRFNDADEVSAIFAAQRPRSFGTGYVATRWEGHFSHYVTADGMRVPSAGEVGWWVEDRWHRVWEGTASDFRFEPIAQP